MKWPLDNTPHLKDPRSAPLTAGVADGLMVYVQDGQGIVQVLPDGPYMHPKVLGGGQAAMYAGDLTIANGRVADLTNLSGTVQFDDEAGLRTVAEQIRRQGVAIEAGAVRFFPADGSAVVVLE
jgi:hypothetical protein